MKTRVIIAFVVLFSLVTVRISLAEEPAAQTVEQQYAQRCTLAQNYLKDIQRPRDLRARVDRLQAYRYIYQRLDVFVKRLEKNKQPKATELRAALSEFDQDIDKFKRAYETYDAARDKVVSVVDCRNHMDDFQEKLAKARTTRQLVSEATVNAEAVLDPEFKGQLEQLHEVLLTTGASGGER